MAAPDMNKADQFLLAEYQALRAEIDQYSQRIDRISGVYLTVLFAVTGFLVRPDSEFSFDTYLMKVQENESMFPLFGFMSILNSALIMRLASFYAAILALAQYVQYGIGARINTDVGRDVLLWDSELSLGAKRRWLRLRTLAQGALISLALLVSATIIYFMFAISADGDMNDLVKFLSVLSFLGALFAIGNVLASGSKFHKPSQ